MDAKMTKKVEKKVEAKKAKASPMKEEVKNKYIVINVLYVIKF